MAFNVELVALLEDLFTFRHLVPSIMRNAMNCTLEYKIDEISNNALNNADNCVIVMFTLCVNE